MLGFRMKIWHVFNLLRNDVHSLIWINYALWHEYIKSSSDVLLWWTVTSCWLCARTRTQLQQIHRNFMAGNKVLFHQTPSHPKTVLFRILIKIPVCEGPDEVDGRPVRIKTGYCLFTVLQLYIWMFIYCILLYKLLNVFIGFDMCGLNGE